MVNMEKMKQVMKGMLKKADEFLEKLEKKTKAAMEKMDENLEKFEEEMVEKFEELERKHCKCEHCKCHQQDADGDKVEEENKEE